MATTLIPVLTIAGSDSSGGAGVQADLKTFLANGVYGMSAVTALTAQNTQGVTAIQEATPAFLAAELDAVFDDIPPRAVKVGMVASAALIHVIAEKLKEYHAPHLVVDPVMVATSGASLLADDAAGALTSELLPLAEILTPNIPELARLTGKTIESMTDLEAAAKAAAKTYGTNVLAKGGHFASDAALAIDLLVTPAGDVTSYAAPRSANPNTHGTGCTLSSAIAATLAKGKNLKEAVGQAKAYLTGAIQAGLDLGKGRGPLHHGWDLTNSFLGE